MLTDLLSLFATIAESYETAKKQQAPAPIVRQRTCADCGDAVGGSRHRCRTCQAIRHYAEVRQAEEDTDPEPSGTGQLAHAPTDAPAGSPAKIAVLCERARLGLALFHPGDSSALFQ